MVIRMVLGNFLVKSPFFESRHSYLEFQEQPWASYWPVVLFT